jgi:hypothetical protein
MFHELHNRLHFVTCYLLGIRAGRTHPLPHLFNGEVWFHVGEYDNL